MANRLSSLLGWIWGSGSVGNPPSPGPPVASTTYTNSALAQADLAAGWPYTNPVDSSKFNEVMKRITTMLAQLEEQGVMTFSALTASYPVGALAFGSDGNLYTAIQASTSASPQDPTTASAYWTKVNLSALVSAANIQDCAFIYVSDTTNTNAYVGNLSPVITSYPTPLWVLLNVANPNTSAATPSLALNSLAAKTITDRAGEGVRPGAVRGLNLLFYNGTNFELHSPRDNTLSGVITTNSAQSVTNANSGETYVATGNFTATLAHTTTLSTSHQNIFNAYGGTITITPNAADAINGGTAGVSLILQKGEIGWLITDGAGNIYVAITLPPGPLSSTLVGTDANGKMIGATLTVNPSPGFISNLVVKNNTGAPTTKIDVTADAVVTTDGTSVHLSTAFSQTMNSGAVGANGLSTDISGGVLAVSTQYYLYAIYGGVPGSALLLSSSATAPALPATYTYWRNLPGFPPTNSSANFLGFMQHNSEIYLTIPPTVLSAGTATTFTPVSLASFVPPLAVKAILGVGSSASGQSYLSADGTNTYFYVGSDTATNGCQFEVPLLVAQTVWYKRVNSGTVVIVVLGYKVNL